MRKLVKNFLLLSLVLFSFAWINSFDVLASEQENDSILDDYDIEYVEKAFMQGGVWRSEVYLTYTGDTKIYSSYDEAVNDLGVYLREFGKIRVDSNYGYCVSIPIKFKSEEISDFISQEGKQFGDDVYEVLVRQTLDPEEGNMLLTENAIGGNGVIESLRYEDGYYSGIFNFNASHAHSEDEYNIFQQKTEEILDSLNLNDYKTDCQKLYAIYKWIGKNIEYVGSSNADAYKTLTEGTAACTGYASLFQYFILYTGIEVYRVSGNYIAATDGREMSHTWNLVKLDDGYYYVDSTQAEIYSTGIDPGFDFIYGSADIGHMYNLSIHQASQDLLELVSETGYPEDYITCTHDSTELRNEKAAALAEDGYTGDTYCQICNQRIYRGEAIPKENFDISFNKESYEYTGKEIIPSITVSYKNAELEEETDYTVSIENNIEIGEATVTITGKGEYQGSTTVSFNIVKADISQKSIILSNTIYEYTGDVIEPEVSITGLTEGVDYTVSYANNSSIGTASVTVEGIGNYEGRATKEFTIKQADISSKDVVLESYAFEYTGNEIKPVVSVEGLTQDTDYTVTYANNVDVGTAVITVTGTGNYCGIATKEFVITQKILTEDDWSVSLSSDTFVYTGSEIIPTVSIEGLTEGVDYTVSCQDNVNVGTATILITGIGKYDGVMQKTFTITAYEITDMSVVCDTEFTYTGNSIEPTISIEGLTQDTDYTVAYSNNVDAGTAVITVTGTGNYSGTLTKNFTILPVSIQNKSITLDSDSYKYNGNEIKPTVSIEGLTQGNDYTVTYKDNVNAGTSLITVTGTGNYSGTLTKEFTILPVSIQNQTIVLNSSAYEYTGEEIKPGVSVGTLTQDTDYSITYQDNIEIGTAKVIITGKGNYTGSVEESFRIVKRIVNINTLSITLTPITCVYTGTPIEPTVSIEGLTQGTDYTVSYADNVNAGTAELTVTGIGSYTGVVEKMFTITPKTLQDDDVILEQNSYEYTGEKIKPTVSIDGLEKETDYTVYYGSNLHAGEGTVRVNGDGNYTGTVTKDFTITPKTLENEEVTLDQSSYEYTGEEIEPEVIFDTISGALFDYTVSYQNNVEIGTGTVVVTCADDGDYIGTVEKQFSIEPVDIGYAITSISVDNNGFSAVGNSYYYTGSSITPKIELDGLTEGVDYTVSYKNNVNVGSASIVVTGKGVYTGTYCYNFSIIKAPNSSTQNTGSTQTGTTGTGTVNTGKKVTKVSSVKIKALSNKIAAGKKVALRVTVTPANAANKKLKWTSSNTKVATVTQNGIVTLKKKTGGKKVTITAISTDGSNKKAVFTITSMKGVVKKITVSGSKTVKAGKSIKLKAKVKTTKGANKKLVWSSSNTKYAKVSSSGKVKTFKAGKGKKVKITAMATDGSGKKKIVTIKIK